MAEVSRKLGAGLPKLSSLKTYQTWSTNDRPPAASAVPCCSGRAVLGSRGERAEGGSAGGRRAGRVKLEYLTGTPRAVSVLRHEPPGRPPQPSLTTVSVLLDPEQAFIGGVTGQLPPTGSPGCYSKACWVNRRALLTAGSSRIQSTGHFHRAYCTLLLTDRWPRHHPRVIVTQARGWSNSHSPDTPLYRSRSAYYDLLQVSPSATQAQIKTAYYKQSFLYHPDKNAGSEEATNHFARISEAYSVLGSVGLRKKYDRGILSAADIQGAGRPSGKEASPSSRSSGPQHQGRKRSQTPSKMTVGGKPVFDFDAFYKAHYGEQLQREQAMREWRKQEEKRQELESERRKQDVLVDVMVGVLLALGCILSLSSRR
ncbi:dnaJ (Hsp40) homolog, subfamily C, member 30b [Salminus brasiliensis]|uniref:dnaJ (Hsp40) homolog, subfamily C, member 30b n=1 Tax=Salminus brasiliensis TaxID=930266 RepID=UPI003B839690